MVVVSVSVPFFVSVLFFIFVVAAVAVMTFVVPSSPVISGRCSAAVTASFPGLAPQAPSCGGVSRSGLSSALLQAGGAQSVDEEALVGAS